jgi:hypothetical protein
MDNENIKNKINGVEHENEVTEFLSNIFGSKVTELSLNYRMYKLDEDDKSLYNIVLKYMIKSLKDSYGYEGEIRVTRLNNEEKIIFEKYIYSQIKKQRNPIRIDIEKISKEIWRTKEEIKKTVRGLKRQIIIIYTGDFNFPFHLFNSLDIISDRYVDIRCSDNLKGFVAPR